MKKMLCLGAALVAVGLSTSVFAAGGHVARGDKAPGAARHEVKQPKAPAAEAKEMTLTGKISKEEIKTGEKTRTVYQIETADGKVKLPSKNTTVKLDDFVGQDVKMVVMGSEAKDDAGKTVIKVKEIKSVEKAPVVPPAPVVPVAAPVGA